MPERSEHIIISRTDSIGDVMLTLPLAGLLKQRFPNSYLTFLGRNYTIPVLECCPHIDRILTLEQLTANGESGAVLMLRQLHADAFVHVFPVLRIAKWASAAGIDHRIGTSHRWWNWLYCNHRPSFSRRKSDLHEAQLNVKLLAPFGYPLVPLIKDLVKFKSFRPPLPDQRVKELLTSPKKKVILHPMSSGSAVEWGLDRFTELIRLLHPAYFQIIITGTETEAEQYRSSLPIDQPNVIDAGGKLSLHQLIALIGQADALVAASTGPLHIAAASGIRAIGLYANVRPIHPGRWAPIGRDTHSLFEEDVQSTDPKEMIHAIRPERVLHLLEELQ
jgi:ADP-heptose:LPS heptosyltransferase